MVEGTDDPSCNPIIELQPLLRNGERASIEENPRMLLVRDPNTSVYVGVSINFPAMDAVANGERRGNERRTGNNAVTPSMTHHLHVADDGDGYGNVEMTEELAY